MAAKSEKIFSVSGTESQVLDAVEIALGRFGANVTGRDNARGRITAKTKVGLKSWGEKLTLEVSENAGQCLLLIRSQSALPTQVIDWGKHKENIKKIVEQLGREGVYAKTAEQVSVEEDLVSVGLMCPKCHVVVPEGTKFCPFDGTAINLICPECKDSNIPTAQFCSNCGAQLQ